MNVSIIQAKAELSKLVGLVSKGTKVVITKNNRPVADIVAHKPLHKRKLGLLKGRFSVPADILDESDEINRMFYGSPNGNHH
jgi:prevent-host-death family protein